MCDSIATLGFCPGCGNPVPAEYVEREGTIYLRKSCVRCGVTAAKTATDASRWHARRALCDRAADEDRACGMDCPSCRHPAEPTIVFVDVTNRCNLHCPMCIADVEGMGYDFHPPLAYFERIFARMARMERPPTVQLFGGEPTVRGDLLEIVALARGHGLSVKMVTNGVRLADMAYCRSILESGCGILLSFDGFDESRDERLRGERGLVGAKLRALENLRALGSPAITLMSAIEQNKSARQVEELLAYCHERRDLVHALNMIPLETRAGDTRLNARQTTIDDVERMVEAALPGTMFLPAGFVERLPTLRRLFGIRQTFGGAHPNCESVTMLISDGNHWHPLSEYYTRPLEEVAQTLMALDARLAQRVRTERRVRRRDQLRGIAAMLRTLWPLMNHERMFGARPRRAMARMLWGLVRGGRFSVLMRRHTQIADTLRIIVLPFEQPDHIDAERLAQCPAAFAYEHPLTREVSFMPVCAWSRYKPEIQRATAERYRPGRGAAPWPGDTTAQESSW